MSQSPPQEILRPALDSVAWLGDSRLEAQAHSVRAEFPDAAEAWPLPRPVERERPTARLHHLVVATATAESGSVLPMLELLRLRGADCEVATSCDQLLNALRLGDVELLILDLDLLKLVSLAELVQLRHRFPDVRWILASRATPPPCADLVLKWQARGCIRLDDLQIIGRSIDTVLAGDLWFSRRLTDELYGRLLCELRSVPVDGRRTGDGARDDALTPRESETMQLLGLGMTNKQIARHLGISVDTVKKHLKFAFDKRGLHCRRQAFC